VLHRGDEPRWTPRRQVSAPSCPRAQAPAFITGSSGLLHSPLGGHRLTRMLNEEDMATMQSRRFDREQLRVKGHEKPLVIPEKVIESNIMGGSINYATSSALNLLSPADMRSVGKAIGETNQRLQEPLYHGIVENQRAKSSSSQGRKRASSKDLLQPILRSIPSRPFTFRSNSETIQLPNRSIVDNARESMVAKTASKEDSSIYYTPPTSIGNITPVTGRGWSSNNSTPTYHVGSQS